MQARDDREVAIAARGVSKEYGHRAVLSQIDLTIFPGQAIGVMGANGVGKTTLLGCLAAIIRPTAGEVLWFGRAAAAAVSQRKWIGMVAHESRLYPQLTLLENLVFAGRMYGLDRPRRRAVQGLAEAGLAACVNRLPAEISRGTRQRAAVARALLHEPRILLFDEPFSGLDADGVTWLLATLRQRCQAGCAVCFTTHDHSKARRLADTVWHLHAAGLRETDPDDGSETTDGGHLRRAA